jgi:hypothetical protein
MDWGKGILLTLVAFVALMLSLVAICVTQDDIHLVTQNYYEEEIKYQDQIDKMINASQLENEVLVFDNLSKIVDLHLPVGSKGTLHLFRPSDARLDKKIEFDITDPVVNSIDVKTLKSGYWRMKLSWTDNGKAYYQEKEINI